MSPAFREHQDIEARQGQAASRHSARGMTLIELVVIASMFCCAFLGAHYFGRIIDGGWGRILGGLIGFVLSFIAMTAAVLARDLATGGMPRLPNCREGTCRGSDAYKLDKSGNEYHLICRHGGRYKRRGRKFVVVNADGTEAPYLVWIPFHGWSPDGSKIATKTAT